MVRCQVAPFDAEEGAIRHPVRLVEQLLEMAVRSFPCAHLRVTEKLLAYYRRDARGVVRVRANRACTQPSIT